MQRPSSASRPSTAGRSRAAAAPRPTGDVLTPRGTSTPMHAAAGVVLDASLSLSRQVPAAPRLATAPVAPPPPPPPPTVTYAHAGTSTEPQVDAQRQQHMQRVEELLRRVKLGDVTERPSPSFHTIVASRQKLLDELEALRQQHAEQQHELGQAKRALLEKGREVTSLQLRMKLDGAVRGTSGATAVFIDVTGSGGRGSGMPLDCVLGAAMAAKSHGEDHQPRSLHFQGSDSRHMFAGFGGTTSSRSGRSALQDDMAEQALGLACGPSTLSAAAVLNFPAASSGGGGGGRAEGLEKVKEQWRLQQQRESEHQHQASTLAFMEETAAWKAQLQIIASLETENGILRRQRDDQLAHAQKEHERLLQEVEEARDKLEEGSAHWGEKQKELNRLRVLMRFSQLKRDSDKLQETYKRVDELENQLRRSHQNDQRTAIDKEDLKRLKLLELHVQAVFDGSAGLSSVPPHLLRRHHHFSGTAVAPSGGGGSLAGGVAPPALAAAVPMRAAVVRPSTAKLSRPSTPNLPGDCGSPLMAAGREVSLEASTKGGEGSMPERCHNPMSSAPPAASPTDYPIGSDGVRSRSTTPAAAAAAVYDTLPTGGGAAQQAEPSPAVADTDVSFTTITERMQQYLERRKRQKEEAELAEKLNQQQQQAAEAAISRKLVRPSSGRSETRKPSLLTRPGSAGTRSHSLGPAFDAAAAHVPPKSFAYIGGRMVPIHGR